MKTVLIDSFYPSEAPTPKKYKTILKSALLTLLFVAASVLIVQFLHRFSLEAADIILIYTLFVVIISRVTPGYVFGIFAAVACSFAYSFLSVPPFGTFQFSYKFTVTLFSMLVVTLITSVITARMKKQTAVAKSKEHRAQLLLHMKEQLLATRALDSIAKITNKYLVSQLKCSVVFFAGDPALGNGYFTPHPETDTLDRFTGRAEMRLAEQAFDTRKLACALSEAKGKNTYLPIYVQKQPLGVVGIACSKDCIDNENKDFVKLLLSQVALSLELQRLSDNQNYARTEAEKEKMRSSLLRAISHDLRTPLTSILGASTTLLENKSIDDETKGKLLHDINDGSQWLVRVVENLLSVTRINENQTKVTKIPEAGEEVVAQAVSIVRSRFPLHSIHVRVPDELLIIPMDATLISQVLINLMENAAKNSDPSSLIFLDLKKEGTVARFSVSDQGSGIPEELLNALFEIHPINANRSSDSHHGMGIGLSICETIIHAHGGEIEGHNKEKCGAIFSFVLPLKEDINEPQV